MRIALLLILSILLTGCYTKKAAIRKFCKPQTTTHDSTVMHYTDSIRIKDSTVQVIERDTVIKKGFSGELEFDLLDSLKRLKDLNVQLGNKINGLSVKVNNGKLTVACNCEDQINTAIRETTDRLREQYQSKQSDTMRAHVETTVVERQLTAWEKFYLAWYGKALFWVGIAHIGLFWLRFVLRRWFKKSTQQ